MTSTYSIILICNPSKDCMYLRDESCKTPQDTSCWIYSMVLNIWVCLLAIIWSRLSEHCSQAVPSPQNLRNSELTARTWSILKVYTDVVLHQNRHDCCPIFCDHEPKQKSVLDPGVWMYVSLSVLVSLTSDLMKCVDKTITIRLDNHPTRCKPITSNLFL